ncbi:hypothetical protein OJF2_09670 [Aquisphaera giovannonii]|uniref:SGNH hydrolase-type esterase domain-containing protein n=2 Tax=Aquisphaera giovannonii TaxID=406548 RepID=A0A5B9VXZ2_9BACT|nr:hypothetical protein OJF2_09670 [Aquisphaera giovannonii]
MGHVILLGDSVFDNARYVPGGPSVIEHTRRALPAGWRATLLAVDGSVASGVRAQLDRLPADATQLVVSVGGNDALGHSALIHNAAAASFAEVLHRLGEICVAFQADYRAMLQALAAKGLPTIVCTVYDAIPGLGLPDLTGLRLFNEVILREAFRAGLSVIDLRLICREAADYASTSPIEPSAQGGGKIARVVARAVAESGGPTAGSRVFA